MRHIWWLLYNLLHHSSVLVVPAHASLLNITLPLLLLMMLVLFFLL
jgi:hypothetical protein